MRRNLLQARLAGSLQETNNETFNFQAGNHFVWEFWRGKTLNVPSSYGLLHHYRKCEFGG